MGRRVFKVMSVVLSYRNSFLPCAINNNDVSWRRLKLLHNYNNNDFISRG